MDYRMQNCNLAATSQVDANSPTPKKPYPVPSGYTLAPLNEGFLNLIGPLYAAPGVGGTLTIALQAAGHHANRYGVVHGGLLSTLADVAIGMNLCRSGEAAVDALTINLSLDFLGSCSPGEWIEAYVTLSKRHGHVRFGECRLMVESRMVVRGSAVFYVKP